MKRLAALITPETASPDAKRDRRPRARRRAPVAAVALALSIAGAACVGTIGEGDGTPAGAHPGSGAGDDGSGRLGQGTADADPKAAGALSLRRLTVTEYTNTVRDLLADPSIVVALAPDPAGTHGFSEAPLLSDDAADALRDAAETLAARAVARFDALLACDAKAQGDEACARAFVARFGRRAFRRALAPDEILRFMALYASARNDLKYDLKDATRMLVTAFLQSPSFLYHWELGSDAVAKDGSVATLSPYQLASRLSYFLWSTMPDDALLDRAGAGALATEDGLAAEVDRLLASERFAESVTLFHDQWLELDREVQKDPTLFPEFGAPLRAAMEDETSRFLRYVFLEGDGKLATLFTSTVADVDPSMATLYGLPAGGMGVRRVSLDPATRAGLLTRASLLAVDANAAVTNPPRSGAKLWQKLLCKTIAPPPPGAAAAFHFDPALSTRENFAKLESDASCKGCHAVINPIGFAFEGYDAIGRHRTMDGSHAVDSSGILTSDPARPRPFSSIVDLSRTLATDPDATSCIARQWLRFALQRSESDADRFSLESAYARFTGTTYDVRALLKAFAMSRTFRYRAVEAGETL
jgi:hypothetical protein